MAMLGTWSGLGLGLSGHQLGALWKTGQRWSPAWRSAAGLSTVPLVQPPVAGEAGT